MSYKLHDYIKRQIEQHLRESLSNFPATAILGPRQCGKSTLAKHILKDYPNSIYLDLELPSSLRKLDDPEFFLSNNKDKLVCIDEIQLKPDLFPVLRALIDQNRIPARFLMLGSASKDLIRQSSETLAGRIHYIELTPFKRCEIRKSIPDLQTHWLRGGFPPALLAKNNKISQLWLKDFIQDHITRDLPQFGFSLPAGVMLRFLSMLAHSHGSLLNSSKLGASLGVSHNTIKKYIDILEQTFLIRTLKPIQTNLKKRLVKSPKIYIRDSGILHSLLEISDMNALFGHPSFGHSWEGWAIEQTIENFSEWKTGFYRTSYGEEIDLVLEKGDIKYCCEFKASLSPSLTKGTREAINIIQPEKTWIVCPITTKGYFIADKIKVCGIDELIEELTENS